MVAELITAGNGEDDVDNGGVVIKYLFIADDGIVLKQASCYSAMQCYPSGMVMKADRCS